VTNSPCKGSPSFSRHSSSCAQSLRRRRRPTSRRSRCKPTRPGWAGLRREPDTPTTSSSGLNEDAVGTGGFTLLVLRRSKPTNQRPASAATVQGKLVPVAERRGRRGSRPSKYAFPPQMEGRVPPRPPQGVFPQQKQANCPPRAWLFLPRLAKTLSRKRHRPLCPQKERTPRPASLPELRAASSLPFSPRQRLREFGPASAGQMSRTPLPLLSSSATAAPLRKVSWFPAKRGSPARSSARIRFRFRSRPGPAQSASSSRRLCFAGCRAHGSRVPADTGIPLPPAHTGDRPARRPHRGQYAGHAWQTTPA